MLKNNMYFSPFMGDNKQISVGLNPLGVRTASEQLFTTLLPGLNVVSLRIRYYSFYCWLLKRFYEKRTKAKRIDFQRYIRLSELLMALIHAQSENSGGIPGITRASEIISKDEDRIDFNEDAMPEGKPVGGYWKGSYGAFGTYYAASLREIGVIAQLEDNTDLYNITPKTDENISGELLADAFEESVGKEMSKLFIECVQMGVVTREQLSRLEPVFQCHELPDSDECSMLLKLILQNDRPTTLLENAHRKDTLRLLLSYVNNFSLDDFSELKFARYVYDCYNEGKENSLAAVGWYAYYLNDSRQYESLNIFNVVLSQLQNSTQPGQWEYIDDFTSLMAEDVCVNLGAVGKSVRELLDSLDMMDEPTDKMAHAFYVILDDYRKNLQYKNCKSLIRTYFQGVSNDAFDAFDSIERSMDAPFFQYVKRYLTENVIYNHYSEAMRKYSQNGIPTNKLIIENGFVRGIETFSASHSSPRIDTLRNFAIDLGLIENNRISEKGLELLTSLQNDCAQKYHQVAGRKV